MHFHVNDEGTVSELMEMVRKVSNNQLTFFMYHNHF